MQYIQHIYKKTESDPVIAWTCFMWVFGVKLCWMCDKFPLLFIFLTHYSFVFFDVSNDQLELFLEEGFTHARHPADQPTCPIFMHSHLLLLFWTVRKGRGGGPDCTGAFKHFTPPSSLARSFLAAPPMPVLTTPHWLSMYVKGRRKGKGPGYRWYECANWLSVRIAAGEGTRLRWSDRSALTAVLEGRQ